jgi:hypothetical protein
MPYVLDPDEGKFIVTIQGVTHEITCRVDPISQRPVIHDQSAKSKKLQIGTGEKSLLSSSAATQEKDGKSKNLQVCEDKKSLLYSGTEVRLEWGPGSTRPRLFRAVARSGPFPKERLLRMGFVEKSFTYASQLGKNPNLPWVLECAFGWAWAQGE